MSDGPASIAFYQERSATDVINVTFQFLREQFVALTKGLLLLAGPFLIAANMVAPFATGVRATQAGGIRPGPFLLQIVLTLIGSVIACAVVIGALQVYQHEDESALTTGRLWDMVRTHAVPLFGRQIQIGLVVGMGAAAIAFVFAILGAAFGVFQGESVVVAVVIGGFFVLALLGWFLYAAPTFSLLFPGQVDAERSISIMRCVDLIKEKWGQTLGVWILAAVITAILSSVGRMPATILGFFQAMGGNSTGTGALLFAGAIAGVTNTLAPAVSYTAITFQYYNLLEQKEHVSLEEEVDRLDGRTGAAADPSGEKATQAGQHERGGTAETDALDSETTPSDPGSSPAAPDDDQRWKGGASGPKTDDA